MDPQEELNQLLARQQTLQQELKAKKKELQYAQRSQRSNLQKQIRRTRRLILLGSYLEHLTSDDPGKRDRPRKDLDGFLGRPRDRALFDLPPRLDPGS